jgi:hypothetical protein
MYQSAEQLGLTKDEINKIADGLWKNEVDHSVRKCPDCGVDVNKEHEFGCDIARCLICGGQHLGCGCKTNTTDVWSGIFPGIRECYNEKLICSYDGGKTWILDLNSYYSKKV